ncbi:Lrp/AsnC family transcriptional regulator [Streptomyces olivoreticuli]|uniref:Lrp/AsnC family transcriptional regulator n=1 Tax=Streptomyces olivoreticuli TaxID=68246 RepID=UPI000E25267C|nr:Lrp/AsnC family transcriptional regulator [Streptomyces olivoreticuli]
MDSSRITPIDLRILHALQIYPRASWALLGEALGISPATVARRWARMKETGLAWTSAYPSRVRDGAADIAGAYVFASCAPGTALETASALAQHPEALSVELTVGERDLFITIAAPNRVALGEYLLGPLSTVPGLLSFDTTLLARLHLEGSQWRLRALPPDIAHNLRAAAGRHERVPPRRPADEVDQQVLDVLGEDGRASYAVIAAACGISESMARRRTESLLASGGITVRCDVAWEIAGWPVSTTLAARVPPERLPETVRAFTVLPEARLVASCVGVADLLVSLWLPSVQDIPRMAAAIAGRFPDTETRRWLTGVRAVKRVGRLLDAQGRATGWVAPFQPAAPPPQEEMNGRAG